MQLVVGGPLHPVVRRLGVAQHLLEVRRADLLRALHRRRLHRLGDVPQLPLHPAQRLVEQADPLVEPGHRAGRSPTGGRK